MSTFSERKCTRCAKNSILIDDSTGEKFCSECGYVISEKSEQETSLSHSSPNNSSKVSSTMPNIGSSTIINPQNKDASGKPLSTSMKSTIERLRTWDSRSQSHEPVNKNLKQAQIEIDKLKDKLILSDSVIEKTKSIYKKAIERKLTRGYTIKGLVGACLYASCKNLEIPRTVDEIAVHINIKKNDVSRCYKLIVRELELKPSIIDPIKHVPKIASKVGFSEKTQRKAIRIIKQIQKTDLNLGKEPLGIVASSLYLAGLTTKEAKSQKIIAEASGITSLTIRNRCKDIAKSMDWEKI